MKSKEKALNLIASIEAEKPALPYSFCKSLALLMANQIEKGIYEYILRRSFPDFNLTEKEYWDRVRSEINKQ